MKINRVSTLLIPEIKVINFARFKDSRGYFTESFSHRDFKSVGIEKININQVNESFSTQKTMRGLHFQWNPYMGKLVRTVFGHMIDLILDIRIGSPTFGKMLAYDMPSNLNEDFNECIWVPHGFAHGNIFLEDTLIQYLCDGEYSQGNESGISPFAKDIDYSLCDPIIKKMIDDFRTDSTLKITSKDKNALNIEEWSKTENAKQFIY